MEVTVRAFARFREIAGEEIRLDMGEGSTILDLLEALSATNPELAPDILGSDGKPSQGVAILRNRKGLDLSDLQKTILEEGDEVALLPPFSGG
ncbi:ubiquitin-like small modifier protein 1 [Methanocrinis sp.]|uniref:ubiquitin-like small modifier protein 1 n=1 Tax=Methanocrinis sp. TaxID=3101522 RepID=UPI003D0CCDA7